MRRFFFVATGFASLLRSISANADTLTVGPGKTYDKPCAAIAAAHAGDIVAVDASGNYDGDNCAWDTDNLTVRGVGGRAKINLTSPPSNKKGIFTITAANATIENFEFSGAAIAVGDGNDAAGIRHQGLNLTVRGCYFHDNQDGILGAPAIDQSATAQPGQGSITVETSEFSHNGAGDGQSHNMYIGNYGRFTLRASYSHGAVKGQLVKTRAYENLILYNRITDESGTTSSYEIDMSNGGIGYVIGNLIEQSAESENDNIVESGAEGASNPGNQLFVVNNTIVNDQTNGTFVDVNGGVTATIVNNVLRGPGSITNAASPTLVNNWDDEQGDPMLVNQASYDYHLAAGSPCIDQGADAGAGPDQSLTPDSEYVHPTSIEGRVISGAAIDIGAYELGGAAPFGDGGTGSGDGGNDGGATNGDGGVGDGPGDDASSPSNADSGCGCTVVGTRTSDSRAWALLAAAAGLVITRSRIRRKKA